MAVMAERKSTMKTEYEKIMDRAEAFKRASDQAESQVMKRLWGVRASQQREQALSLSIERAEK